MTINTGSESRDTLRTHLDLLRVKCEVENHLDLGRAPIFTESARQGSRGTIQSPEKRKSTGKESFSQYGLIAGDINGDALGTEDRRLFYNVAAPASTFICGNQGSGKSHTLSCLFENCLLQCAANVLPRPLTGIIFHYDTFTSDTGGSPCEAAYLSSHPDVSVRVLCAPTNTAQIQRIYRKLPNVSIEELRIEQTDLNTRRMLDLMAASPTNGERLPLYLHVVSRILRDMRVEQQKTGSSFNYGKFKTMILQQETLNPSQLVPLQQRLDTLESFMVKMQATHVDGSSSKSKKSGKKSKGSLTNQERGTDWLPKAGQLTIVDLSCPCVTAETACSLFNICLSLFLEQDTSIGRVVGLDEAHKYMADSEEARTLTDSLLSSIRLQRHLGVRIIISTQEPTISPRLLDLCAVTIVHGFTSPEWLQALEKHLAGASRWMAARNKAPQTTSEGHESCLQTGGGVVPLTLEGNDICMEIFSRIVDLRAGEALIFAPSAILHVEKNAAESKAAIPEYASGSNGSTRNSLRVTRLGQGILKVRVRKRITADGGASVTAM